MALRRDEDGDLPNAETETNRLAVASLVLGLAGVVLCLGPIAGIPAVACGLQAFREFRRYPGAFAGRGMAYAGVVLGCAAVVAFVVLAVAWLGLRSELT